MPNRSQSRLQGGKVDRPLPPARLTAWQPLTAASDCDLLLHSPEVAKTLLSRRLRTIVNNCFHLKAESNRKIKFVRLKKLLAHTLSRLYIFFSPLNPIGNVEIQFLAFITQEVSIKQFPV